LEFEVTEASISAETGIPISGENWFKAMVLSSPFVKVKNQNDQEYSIEKPQVVVAF
jgi:hypothetical protein